MSENHQFEIGLSSSIYISINYVHAMSLVYIRGYMFEGMGNIMRKFSKWNFASSDFICDAGKKHFSQIHESINYFTGLTACTKKLP